MFKTFRFHFLCIWLTGIFLYFPLMNAFNAWFDEQFSLYLTGLSWSDMLKMIISDDGHPPLHYILLKLWNTGHDYHDVGWSRLLSLVLLAATALLGAFPVRRLCGDKIALWFTAFVFVLPRSLFLGTDMRMYGLLNLEMTAMVVYAMLALKGEKTSDWIKFFISALLAMYTHYFGVLSLAILNIFLFFALIRQKKHLKRQMCFLFGGSLALACAFLPWFITVFLGQATNMYSDWYPTRDSLENTFLTFLKPIFGVMPIPALAIVSWFSALMWLLLIQASFDRKQPNRGIIRCVLIVFYGVLVVATSFSLLVRPMMSWRYLLPYAGCLALSSAAVISEETRFKKIFLVLLTATFGIFYVSRFVVVHDPFYRLIQSSIRADMSPDKVVFLCGEEGQALLLDFYLPEYKHYLVPQSKELIIAADVMNPITEMPADFEGKDILLFRRYNEDYKNLCGPAIDNIYDHYSLLCLGQVNPDQAEKLIKEGANFLAK